MDLVIPGQGVLSLVCGKCTKQGRFAGKDRAEAATKAKEAGWSMPEQDRFNCPRCTKVFATAAREGRVFIAS